MNFTFVFLHLVHADSFFLQEPEKRQSQQSLGERTPAPAPHLPKMGEGKMETSYSETGE